jgi:RNA polymerase sigma-70 factor (ECF subfamily)
MTVEAPSTTARFVTEMALRHGSSLHRFLLRRLKAEEDAADVAQEVYLKMMRLERVHLIRQPQAYLYFLAAQVMHEQRMREQRIPVLFDSEAVESLTQSAEFASPDEFVAGDESERELKRLLGKLSPAHRNILILRKRDGMSYQEIAEALGMSVHTVKKYLFQANVRLADMVWK